MTPAIVQLLAELYRRESAYEKAYNRASGFMHSRVHTGALSREEVDGANRLQMKGLDSKTIKDLKDDIRAHLWSYERRVHDPEMHALVMLGLMREASPEPEVW